MHEKVRIGVSACLLGQLVRYDGQHKRNSFVVDTLGPFVEYVPVCPEVECGLTVPRESMRLVGKTDSLRLITNKTKRDLTGLMLDWIKCRIPELEKEGLVGFIFKTKSPSSGMRGVKIYSENGGLSGHGAGLFARAFMDAFPLLPVEDEGRLSDPGLRENFIERIFALERYRRRSPHSKKTLTDFHAANKYLLMSHSPEKCRSMGRLLAAETAASELPALRSEYEAALLNTLSIKANIKKHANVMQHIMGYFKKIISADEKREMLELIDEYRLGLVPLIVPATMLRHYVRKYQVPYLMEQTYLNPHPVELKLRNHA